MKTSDGRETVLMDNRHVDITSAGREHLRYALALLSNGYPFGEYVEDQGQLVLCWGEPKEGVALLYPLRTLDEMVEFVWGWLQNKAEHRHPYEGGEVKNEKGAWRAWCGPWGKDERYEFGFARVEARYAWIGK